eukprot:12424694-Karenia_brevis.AAC.1
MGGSIAKGTDLEDSDMDIVVMVDSLDIVIDAKLHAAVLASVLTCLNTQLVRTGKGFEMAKHYICGEYNDIPCDILLAIPINDVTPLLCESDGEARIRLGASLSRKHVEFVSKVETSTKEAVRLAKWWADRVVQDRLSWTLRSFLVELLILAAADARIEFPSDLGDRRRALN